MTGFSSTQTVIAVCSCGTRFFCEGIDRMNNHIDINNYTVHQWVYVIALTDDEVEKDD